MIVYTWFCSTALSKGSLYGKCSESNSVICGLEKLDDRERLASTLYLTTDLLGNCTLLRSGAYCIRN